MTVRLGNIPRAADIDYNGTEEVYAYSRLLGRLVEWHGGLDAPRDICLTETSSHSSQAEKKPRG